MRSTASASTAAGCWINGTAGSDEMSQRLKERYDNEIAPALMKALNLRNVMEIPRIKKVVVNIGVGEALENAKALDARSIRPSPEGKRRAALVLVTLSALTCLRLTIISGEES